MKALKDYAAVIRIVSPVIVVATLVLAMLNESNLADWCPDTIRATTTCTNTI